MRKTPSPTPSESAAGAGAEAAAPTAAAASMAPEKVVDVTAPSGDSQVATDVHMAGTVVGNGTSTSPSPSPGAGTHEGSLSTADNGTASTAASSVASPAPVAAAAQISLDQILGTDHESLEHPGLNGKPPTGWDEEVVDAPVKEGFCIECEGVWFIWFSLLFRQVPFFSPLLLDPLPTLEFLGSRAFKEFHGFTGLTHGDVTLFTPLVRRKAYSNGIGGAGFSL